MDLLKRWCFFMGWIAACSLLFTSLLQGDNWTMDGPVPSQVSHIFFHNLPFLALFSLPYFGFMTACVIFAGNAFMIAISIHNQGLLTTLAYLPHLPIELFAFTAIMRPSRRLGLSVAVLYIAAVVELRFAGVLWL